MKRIVWTITLSLLVATVMAGNKQTDVYWDTSDQPGLQGGAGKWNAANWNPDLDGHAKRLKWKTRMTAHFTVPCQVAIDGQITVTQIVIESDGCTIDHGKVRFSKGLRIEVKDGATAVIRSTLDGGQKRPRFKYNNKQWRFPLAGLYKDGKGTLTLAGKNLYAGPTTVTDGTLIVAKPESISPQTSFRPEPGTTLGVGYPVNQDFLARVHEDTAVSFTIALTTGSGNDLDFSRNKALRAAYLGAIGKVRYGGTITPAYNTYRLGGGGGRLVVVKPLSGNRDVFIGGYRAAGEVVLDPSSAIRPPVINGVTLRIGSAPVPPSPSAMSAEQLPEYRAKLSWTCAGKNVSSFELQSSLDGKHFQATSSITPAQRSTTVQIKPGIQTWFRLYAKSGQTYSPGFAETSITGREPRLVAPILQEAYGSYSWIDLKWADRSEGEAGYLIQISEDNRNFSDIRTTPADMEMAHLKMKKKGTWYLRLAALKPSGKPGPWSEVKSAGTDPDADLWKDIFGRFDLSSGARQMDPDAPASLPQYDAGAKKRQEQKGASLISDLLANARSNSVYTIPAGTYRIPAGRIKLSELTNFTIKASGVHFFVTTSEPSRKTTVFSFSDCRGITFQGPCTFNQETPYWTSARVVRINQKNHTVEAESLPGHSRAFRDEGEYYFFDRHGHQIYEYKYTKIDYMKDGRFAIHSQNWERGEQIGKAGFAIDERCRYVALPSKHISRVEPVSGGRTTTDFTIRDVTICGMESGHGNTKGTTRYIGYRVLPQPGTTQLMCGQPGQFHMSQGDSLLMDGCEFNTGGDDGINLMTISGVVAMQDSPRRIYINRMYSKIDKGTRLRFYDYKTFEFLGEAMITAAQAIDTPEILNGGNLFMMRNRSRWHDKKHSLMVDLDRDLPNVVYAQVVSPDLGAASVIVRNTYWRDLHAQALLLQGAKCGAVINNFFYRSTMSAVHLTMSQYWQEGSWPHNIVVRNNIILDNPSYARRPNNAAIQVNIRGEATAPCIDGISIEANTIINTTYSAIRVNNGQNTVIRDNVIYRSGLADDDPEGMGGAILLEGGKNITVTNNTYVVNGAPCKTNVAVQKAVDKRTLVLDANTTIPQRRLPPTPRIGK